MGTRDDFLAGDGRCRQALGICLGASTIGMVRALRQGDSVKIEWARTIAHEGNPRDRLRSLLAQIEDLSSLAIAVTGRKFRDHLATSTISEPEAVELAVAHVMPPGHPYRIIMSAGGETFMLYNLDDGGRIQAIHTGNKCASGTGEFFLQQLRRMGITLDETAAMELPDTAHKVSGRCSVFCKSDCTHALNKGVPKPQVIAGLTKMMADKLLELLKQLPRSAVMLIGGCSQNRWLVHHLGRAVEDLHIPTEAPWMEALGAALWAMDHETIPCAGVESIFRQGCRSVSFHRPLAAFREMAEFKHQPWQRAASGDATILGLDVGSTTTKGVIMRRSDKAILAAEYLRTNGDPVGASRRVYESLARQVEAPIIIEGLGVTGSGRQIAALHAMTDGVINEIIAHATAAVHFDPEVDTIFEIGGQDAKYTYITNGVPSDYAMNEACSAGTGSFLEEAAKESLGIDVTAIGAMAMQAEAPPNFSDQCAAFIGSDIKRAAHEGVAVQDIVAGLVYSICMNYANRVKGNRPVGKKIFVQGGVCYNEAVPVAMSALTGKSVVVPPDPGLMGAYGVALAVEQRMEQGLLSAGSFDLRVLAERELEYGTAFTCKGGKEKCDRGCTIARIRINGKTYPFGGICNRYDNLIHGRKIDPTGLDLVVKRERRVFRDLASETPEDRRPTVGINRSFLTHTYFPLYNRFFAELGYRVVLPDAIEPEGVDRQGAAFCFPVEQAHGYLSNLVKKNPDFIFLPHLRGIPSQSGNQNSCTCVFVQGEPYYLRAVFPELEGKRLLTPFFDFAHAIEQNAPQFREIAHALGASSRKAQSALDAAIAEQREFQTGLRAMGDEALEALRGDPDTIAVVLFGRPYNSFTSASNKGIPAKLASRGVRVIPLDMLPLDDEQLSPDSNMYWGMGRMILRGAQYIQKHPQLFGTYITNFSCGPDSFLVGFFRDIMGRKPSLTLELDSHTADAGIETRIEAFLDIVRFYQQSRGRRQTAAARNGYTPARFLERKLAPGILTSRREWVSLRDPRVKVLIPTMGRYGTALLAKVFSRVGVKAEALPPATEEVLKIGRGNSSCKECLPLQTTIGSLLHYLEHRPEGEITAYFMATASGPCRFGQYATFSQALIEKRQIRDLAVLRLSAESGYSGLGERFALAAWRAVVIGDLFDEMWATILAAAENREDALRVLNEEHEQIAAVVGKSWGVLARQLGATGRRLSAIRLTRPYGSFPKLSLIGEIYVRNDPISLQRLVERLAERGFVVRTAKISEWIKYLDWLGKRGIESESSLYFWPRHWTKQYFDRRIRKLLAPSGLFYAEDGDVDEVVDAGSRFVSPRLTGEAILTVGAALHEILEPSCGVISIGPFGCMPSRIAESILNQKLTTKEKRRLHGESNGIAASLLEGDRRLPFLAIETDGNAFPQIIEARLEAFCLQATRLHSAMRGESKKIGTAGVC
ncbi:MAG: activase [Candidatus Hydrogenedentes bacterium]|nr:activase [Candidatus Hydrogenedentota bacterium]